MRKKVLFALLLIVLVISVCAQKLKNVELFDVSPNPMYRYTVISLNIIGPTQVSIHVEDKRGNPVKTIYEGLCQKESSFTWQRDMDDGNYAPDGTYFVVVTCNGRYTSTKKTLILK